LKKLEKAFFSGEFGQTGGDFNKFRERFYLRREKMLKEVETYLLILNDLRNQVKNLLEKFPDEALDWCPIEGQGVLAMNSAIILVTHLAGSESFWIKEVIGGQPIHRNRDAECITKGVAMAKLKRRLEGGAQNTEAILSSLTSAQWAAGFNKKSGPGCEYLPYTFCFEATENLSI
jgi:hypothetical protein